MKTPDNQPKPKHTQELAKKIFEDLNKKGAGLGNVSEILIKSSIENILPNLDKAVNMHDELVNGLKKLQGIEAWIGDRKMKELFQDVTQKLLKQAEQK